MEMHFTFAYRNPGHWDVIAPDGRAFRIRGEPGEVYVFDERTEKGRPRLTFKTINTASAWIIDEFMQESA